MNDKITIYHKFCLECYWKDEFKTIKSYAQSKKKLLTTVRTTSDYKLHEMASNLYGSEKYLAFVYADGKVTDIMEFAKQCKAKPVKNTKAKTPRKKKNEKSQVK